MADGEFSVYQFFVDDLYERVCSFVDPKTAVETAVRLTQSVGGQAGIIRRIIITDGSDCTNFEWKFGEGVTYPKRDLWGRFV